MTHMAPVILEQAPILSVRPPETVSMRTRDGVRLDADVYRPDAVGPWPVLLLRLACGRRTAMTGHYAHPRWYAARGYVVVVQDVRGRGTSEGRFRPFEAEREDGADAVAWAASLPGSKGTVGMYGSGYAGMAQLLALAERPAALRALVPALAGWDVFTDWATEGGAFRLADAMGWALHCAAESARRLEDGAAYRALLEAARALPLDDEIPSRPRVLREYARHCHYDDWLTTPGPGGSWDDLSPRHALSGGTGDVSILQIGGWYDPRLTGTLEAHEALSGGSAGTVRLLVGPWDRHGAVTLAGTLLGTGGPAPYDVPSFDDLQLGWFERFLKGEMNGAERGGPIRLFDVLEHRWRDLPTLSHAAHPLHLSSDGLATRRGGGSLSDAAPKEEFLDVLVHDPRNPVPTVGGHAVPDAGPRDRAAIDARPDVAVYDTAPLTAPLTLSGPASLEIWVEADAPSFDVSAVLSAVLPDGRVLPLAQGHARVEPGGEQRPLPVAMRALCATLPTGSALRLSLAGSCFPAYPVNPGTGAEPGETRLVDAQPITLLIHGGGARPSRLLLPRGGRSSARFTDG